MVGRRGMVDLHTDKTRDLYSDCLSMRGAKFRPLHSTQHPTAKDTPSDSRLGLGPSDDREQSRQRLQVLVLTTVGGVGCVLRRCAGIDGATVQYTFRSLRCSQGMDGWMVYGWFAASELRTRRSLPQH